MATKTKAKASANGWRDLDQEDLISNIIEAREDGKSWAEIKELSGGMALGKLMFLRDVGMVDEKDRIKYKSEEDLPAKFQAAREANLSWGLISARVGLPESKVRAIYEAEFGEGSSKLAGGQPRVAGRGGVVAEKAEKKTSTAKASSKKAPAKKTAKGGKAPAAAKAGDSFGGVKPLAEMDTEELQARLDGKTITVKQGSKNARIVVKAVKETDGEEMEFTDSKGATRTVKISAIAKASR